MVKNGSNIKVQTAGKEKEISKLLTY